MKNLILVLMALMSAGCMMTVPEFRKSLDPDEQVISYIDQHGKTKNDAYVSAHAWIAKNFNSANDVIQMQDKEAGRIIVKAVYPFTWYIVGDFGSKYPTSDYTQYTLSLNVKDKKMKMEFTTGTNKSGTYLPKDMMPDLIAHYKHIHDDLVAEVMSKASDF